MKIKKKIKKVIRKLNLSYFYQMRYIPYYKKLEINPKLIFLESQNGRTIHGNIYYIAKELNNNQDYKDYTVYLSVNPKKYSETLKFLKTKKMDKIHLIKGKCKRYFKLLASAKYLITDTSFTPNYIKKEGQVIFNTWHGTPLKTLGKKVRNDFHDLGNIQKNFVLSDYLLYPNEYMMHHMLEDYMIENIAKGQIILSGYPRNANFFNEEQKETIRKEMQLEDKEVLAYMPTWRGSVSKVEKGAQENLIQTYLEEIDKQLKDNQILYINLHPLVGSQVQYNDFKRIKKFPEHYETYEFLSIADCLITDYSSVFFDFANTKKKVILFTYDEEEYLEERGLYITLDSLPFPQVKTVDELIKEINSPKDYDDTEFLKTYCPYDGIDVSKKLCSHIILQKKENLVCKEIPNNGKENILIFPGNLVPNGITTSLMNLLNHVDTSEKNYFITYETSKITKYKEVLHQLPEGVNYIPTKGKMNLTLKEKIKLFLYGHKLLSDTKYIECMKEPFKLEIKRNYGNIPFSNVIQFNGYNYRKILLYSSFDCPKVIYVHNDMYQEATKKKNTRLEILKYAYQKYDKIALVTKDLLEPICKITDIKNKYFVCNNIIDYKRVLDLAKQDIAFDEKTESNVTVEELREILNNNSKKIINIGRFSKEKGHARLIEAFEKLWQKDNSIYLIIIGGYGKEYMKTLEKANSTICKDHIIIIKYVSNPYAILKSCDYFILPSFYEGFGLVLAEADILGKPVVSTDIVGPRGFMKEHGGMLVKNSTEGVYEGLQALADNKVKVMNVNYEQYNQEAIKQFEKLLS